MRFRQNVAIFCVTYKMFPSGHMTENEEWEKIRMFP